MRLYRTLLVMMLPPGFRRDWGEAMVAEARLQMAEAAGRGGVWGATRQCVRLAADLLTTSAREWWAAIIDAREEGGMMGGFDDLRVGLRGLLRAPGFTVAAVATLAVAVAVNAVVFSLVDETLLRSLPYHEPDRLVALWTAENWSQQMVDRANAELGGVEAVAGYGGTLMALAEGGDPMELVGVRATPGLHDVLGVAPARGRGFTAEDGLPGSDPVVLLSHELWVDRFAADPAIVGRTIALGDEGAPRRTVVGVMPPEYVSLMGDGIEAWVPVVTDPAADRYSDSYSMRAVARLGEDTDLRGLEGEVRRWAATVQERNSGWFSPEQAARADAVALDAALVEGRRTPLLLALGGVGLVLLVACANLANLVLARTASRERELSLRAALGAGRRRTARLVLTETALLGALGAGVGLVLALTLRGTLARYLPDLIPSAGLAFSPRPVLATLGVALACGLVAGLVPALMAAAGDPARALGGARGVATARTGLRLQGGLVAVQLALATTLVASAGLLGRSLGELAAVDPGFTTERALTFRLTAPPAPYATDADVARFFREVRGALAGVPGVEEVGFVSRLPMGAGMSRVTVYPEGVDVPEGTRPPTVDHRLITPGYMEALGARLRSGRTLRPVDDRDDGVVPGVVNRAAAERFWPGEDPVGKLFLGREREPWLRVVGVVENIYEAGVDRVVDPALYILHRDWPWRTMYGVVRTRGEPDRSALEAAVWSVSAAVPVSGVRSLREVVAASRARVRTLGFLATMLGGVALVLGVLGVYGVVAYAAGRRRREYGVRAALGAGRGVLEGRELVRAGRMIVLGVGLGLPGAWLAGRTFGAALYGVTPLAPDVLVPVGALLAGAAFLAAWIPVHRATRVDPVEALRAE